MKSYADGKEGWIICPKCLDACLGIVGKPCSTCETPQVLTPLMGCTVEEGRVVDHEVELPLADLQAEIEPYNEEELALLEEFGV